MSLEAKESFPLNHLRLPEGELKVWLLRCGFVWSALGPNGSKPKDSQAALGRE